MLKPFIALCILLAVGKVIRVRVKFVQKLYLPSAIVAGALGLIIIQSLNRLGYNKLVSDWTSGWGSLPGFLINIVFAALFLEFIIINHYCPIRKYRNVCNLL